MQIIWEYFEIHGFEPNLIQMFSMVVKNSCDRTDHNLIFWFQISDIVFPFIFTDPFFDNRNIVKVVIIQGNIADLIRGLTLKYTAYDMQHNQCSVTYITLHAACIKLSDPSLDVHYANRVRQKKFLSMNKLSEHNFRVRPASFCKRAFQQKAENVQ